MTQTVLKEIYAFVARLKDLYSDQAALVLLGLPLAAFVFAFFGLIFIKKMRPLSRVWFTALSDICVLLFLALALVSEEEELLPAISFALLVKVAYLFLYGLLCALPRWDRAPRRKEKKLQKAQRRAKKLFELSGEEQEESEDAAAHSAAYTGSACGAKGESAYSCKTGEGKTSFAPPPKVRCFTDEGKLEVEKDVRLGHIQSVLERLKAMPLGAGDRLEAEKMGELLSVYRTKGELSAQEAAALNDILAALLKMMAKYDL